MRVAPIQTASGRRTTRMEAPEAIMLGERGEAAKAALRSGALVIVALRLGAARWEPLYATCGPRRVALPSGFSLSLEAIAVLEAATLTQ